MIEQRTASPSLFIGPFYVSGSARQAGKPVEVKRSSFYQSCLDLSAPERNANSVLLTENCRRMTVNVRLAS
jgi:hypothetical protein